ncbi:E3 ubiquitin-protein ligase RNF13-like [Stegodyphus dumicola]|uniref:E3 ubiquitin-protein ligase RNF13-like n=1 Tax=Stegodyphus dumicola TaxID=202533 RepID=UPI0015B2D28A|nr:E3 ubiquitin-protein ligase RNF13-like [Stegodyphus dumicola]
MGFMAKLLCLSSVHFIVVLFRTVDATIEVYDPSGVKVDTIQDRQSPFDDDFAVLEGFILAADPPEACSKIAEPTFLANFTVSKFVLINGTEMCEFTTKVRNAEKAGYDVAVIFDPSPLAFEFFHVVPFPTMQIDIHFVFVSYEDGVQIRSNYLYNNSIRYNYRLRIKPNTPNITYYMYLFGAVLGVCFFVMLLFMMCLLIKCIQERRRSRRNRLSSRQIKQIPTAKFSKGDHYDVCAICLEDYNEGDKLRLLPCSHAYHAKCIDPWLMNNRRNCPLCKRKITFGDSADESDSEDSELTSPAENTPLLASPSNREQSWGTFAVNPVHTINDGAIGGPSSLSDTFQYSDNSFLPADSTVTIESQSEDEHFPAEPLVNNGKDTLVPTAVNCSSADVDIINGNQEGASASVYHGLIV